MRGGKGKERGRERRGERERERGVFVFPARRRARLPVEINESPPGFCRIFSSRYGVLDRAVLWWRRVSLQPRRAAAPVTAGESALAASGSQVHRHRRRRHRLDSVWFHCRTKTRTFLPVRIMKLSNEAQKNSRKVTRIKIRRKSLDNYLIVYVH